jgi:LmbE family N-acetylglucosaminyl deacetylase
MSVAFEQPGWKLSMEKSNKTALVLAPHPDDAEFYAGGTLAKWIAEGTRVVIVIATDGSKGSYHEDAPSLNRIRAEEATHAAAVLGAESPVMLGHLDMGLDLLPPGILREQFVRAIRQYKPDILLAQDPFAPYEVHPDHRAVAWAASDAAYSSYLPLVYHEQGLESHYVVEKYFYSDHTESWNKIVDTSQTMEVKMAALAEHKSQIAFLVEDIMIQARLAGLDVHSLVGEAAHDPLTAMTWFMEAQAAQVGSKIGVRFGEGFRYERFHPIVENFLRTQR